MALLLIVVTTAILRTRDLGALGFSSDEAVYVAQGRALEDGFIPEVRAHPPLWGGLLAIVPNGTAGEVGPRVVAVGMGLLGVVVACLLARELAGRAAGLLAALAAATMPYHADVSRLALVEVPMASAVAVATLLIVVAIRRERYCLVDLAAVTLGVATLFKETAGLSAVALAVSVYMVRGLTRRRAARATSLYLAVVSTYPAYLLVTGGFPRALDYVGWQVQRESAGGLSYADVVLPRMGWGILVAAAVGACAVLATQRRQAVIVVSSAFVPALFYLLWPVASYPYLLVVTVPLAVLAACGVVLSARALVRTRVPVTILGAAAVGLATPASAWGEPPLLPGASGIPAVREVGAVLAARPELPVVTAAPWVANVLLHYLPTHAVSTLAPDTESDKGFNPAYRSRLRPRLPDGPAVVVWDAWSADTDPVATAYLLDHVRERSGRVTHVETASTTGSGRVLVVVFLLDSAARQSN